MSKFQKVFVVTDGASRGNPGASAIGYGIYDTDWGVVEEKAEYIGKATNNEAEYRALVAALERAAHFCKDEVEHFSDSELMVKQLKGQYRVKAENLKPLFEKVSKLRKIFALVKHQHVRRSDKRVAKIDGLANEALDGAGH
ncbi:MAG: ribonuclease HI family protein [Methanosarcinales archaeon]|nr:ribonuclease HI family protein [Methanosarcinales archaeon]